MNKLAYNKKNRIIMSNPSFVHLNVHSEFSLKDSLIRVKPLVKRTQELGMNSVSISDDSNMFAAIRFYQGMMGAGLKPVISSEVHVSHENAEGTMILVAQNDEGYKNLIEIVSHGYEIGRASNDHSPVLPLEYITEKSNGLIALTGARDGIIGKSLLSGNVPLARDHLDMLKASFGDRIYIELQRTDHPQDDQYVHAAVELAVERSVPVVATNKVRFESPEDFAAHEVRVADARGISVDQLRSDYKHEYSPHQYLKSPEEMQELFADIPSALENSVNIANRCSVDITLYKNFLPRFPTPDGISEAQFLEEEARKGLEERFKKHYPDKMHDPEFRKEYEDRLDFELKIVNEMGFPGYFLIVGDFIQWSKDNDIPVGPGRGSGAGSLVAYALKITDLDPLPLDLLFERFLNPERVSMPDFDIDFCMDKRELVIQYVSQKYGEKAVSQIVTFGTLAAKAAIRSAARTLGFPYMVGDRISKMVPDAPGTKLADAFKENLEFGAVYESDLDAKKIIDFATKIEGITRQTGKHAGGVLISPSKLTDFTPTYSEADGSGFVSQFDKNDVETAGLVKFDFLGLKTLTIVDNAIKAVNAKRAKEGLPPIDIADISLEDDEVYEMYANGDTTAVFQVESRGMKELLKKMKPDRFEDLVALVALFRPGPLQSGMVDNFIDRKHGREEISYPDATWQHESLKEILEPTYGIILYQEQVMQIAQTLAGYTLGGADMLRRAMGKKKPEEMEKQRSIFKQGAIDNGVDGELAMKIFDLVEKFAGYGFNKSHSAAYALVSYQTGWLKKHYPAEFMAAVLSADMGNTDKIVTFINECKDMGISIVPPDINNSDRNFVASNTDEIVYGLEAVKGLGGAALSQILEEREHREYSDLFDFCVRCKVNKSVIEKMIRGGMFDSTGVNRASLTATYPQALTVGKQVKTSINAVQADLFGDILSDEAVVKYEEVTPWPKRQELTGEIDVLGLCLTGHPLDEYETEIKDVVTGKLADLTDVSVESHDNEEAKEHVIWKDQSVNIVGLVVDVNISTSKSGHYARLKIDDKSRQIDVMVFNKTFHHCQELLLKGECINIEGKLVMDKKTGTHKLIAFKVQSIDALRERSVDYLQLNLDSKTLNQDKIKLLKELITNHPEGGCKLRATYKKPDGGVTDIALGNKDLKLNNDLLDKLSNLFGREQVDIIYKEKGKESTRTVSNKEKSADMRKAALEEGNRTRTQRHMNIARMLDEARMSM
ncbi:DNA polymerase III subunit alpha [Vibrio harveyi]|uniref:DNA polymerase III subunit alpha n=1 Tax=Vibrio harveyi TaxID=669 RepID=UPI003CF19456